MTSKHASCLGNKVTQWIPVLYCKGGGKRRVTLHCRNAWHQNKQHLGKCKESTKSNARERKTLWKMKNQTFHQINNTHLSIINTFIYFWILYNRVWRFLKLNFYFLRNYYEATFNCEIFFKLQILSNLHTFVHLEGFNSRKFNRQIQSKNEKQLSTWKLYIQLPNYATKLRPFVYLKFTISRSSFFFVYWHKNKYTSSSYKEIRTRQVASIKRREFLAVFGNHM